MEIDLLIMNYVLHENLKKKLNIINIYSLDIRFDFFFNRKKCKILSWMLNEKNQEKTLKFQHINLDNWTLWKEIISICFACLLSNLGSAYSTIFTFRELNNIQNLKS